jgi:MerR family transcriptional regulator, light-induced transcriptional regulator
MPFGPPRESVPVECLLESAPWVPSAGSTWATIADERRDAKGRIGALARTLESDVIPRLVRSHGDVWHTLGAPDLREIDAFAQLLQRGEDGDLNATIENLRRRGLSIAAIYIDLLAPTARRLGELWSQDLCDFSCVTVALGRLQRILRDWSPAFGNEVQPPPNGRRILLGQHPQEQHSFGLAMVAEFFRRAGWEVLGGVGGAVADPSGEVVRDWFDVVGFSLGSELRVDWARSRIAEVRRLSRNRSVVVLVGGPLLDIDASWADRLGADASGHSGGDVVALADRLIGARAGAR